MSNVEEPKPRRPATCRDQARLDSVLFRPTNLMPVPDKLLRVIDPEEERQMDAMERACETDP